jgi:hypothetical protein
MNLDTISLLNTLKSNGYIIINNVLNEEEIIKATYLFHKWKDSTKIIYGPNGIIKDNNAGHQEHAWFIRTRPNILKIFKELWNDELIVSFDGCCYMDKDYFYEGYWTHVDQSPLNTDFRSFQGLVSLTDNINKTLMIYDKSHLLFDSYVKEYNLKTDKNFNIINQDYIKKNCLLEKKMLEVKKGSLIIWDSRLFHQNQCGKINNKEERIVQYISYMPKNHENNTIDNQIKRKYAFDNKITCTHWAAPLKFASNIKTNEPLFDIKEYNNEIYKLL